MPNCDMDRCCDRPASEMYFCRNCSLWMCKYHGCARSGMFSGVQCPKCFQPVD